MNRLTLCVALAATLGTGMGASLAHADSFMYHGSLQDAGKAANGSYDLQLTLYSTATGGHALSSPVTLYGVQVKDGKFVTSVDFGQTTAQSTQSYVQVQVKSAGSSDFVALDQRSPVAPDGGCPGSWALDGNAGNPPGSYLGTADAQPVNILTNGTTVASFNTNQSVGLAYPYTTAGAFSTGIGYNAGTAFEGSIVTGGRNDSTFSNSIRDSATNQVIMVAQHGVGINTSHGGDGGVLHDELTIAPSAGLPAGNADITLQTATVPGYVGFNMAALPNGFFQLTGLFNVAGALNYSPLLYVNFFGSSGYANFALNGAAADRPLRVGTSGSNGNGAFLSATGVWTNASSRTFKDTIAAVDPRAVLDKLVAMPVATWFYKDAHTDGQHMGPIAEDFAQTFGLGSNEKYIGTVDESGVALAAIQGLNHKVEAENSSLKKQNADLRSEMDVIAARLERLEHAKGE
ncbi:MAG: tail fiber domain-containing protein [Dokdonella sp.]|uniref:tail fiber domain-containing protein n=1 Tax=Dokdonella sp. TaxID=2291710 RepID=UPI0032678520